MVATPRKRKDEAPSTPRNPTRQSTSSRRGRKPRNGDSGASGDGGQASTLDTTGAVQAGGSGVIAVPEGATSSLVSGGEGLKVGDRVSITWQEKRPSSLAGLNKGDWGEIVECKLPPNSKLPAQYKLHLGRGGWIWVLAKYLELAVPARDSTPEPELQSEAKKCNWQKGDRVRIVKAPRYVGSLATVKDLDGNRISVLPDGGMFAMDLPLSALEFVREGDQDSQNQPPEVAETEAEQVSEGADQDGASEPTFSRLQSGGWVQIKPRLMDAVRQRLIDRPEIATEFHGGDRPGWKLQYANQYLRLADYGDAIMPTAHHDGKTTAMGSCMGNRKVEAFLKEWLEATEPANATDSNPPAINKTGGESITKSTPLPQHLTDLTQLATDINQLHNDCEQALTIAQSAQVSALEHAKEAGLLLLQAKRVCGHGGWEKWREANLQLPSSTATLYQRIADRWDELQESGVATVKGAMDYLKKARIKSATDSQPVAEMQPVVHEKDLTATLQAAQADFHQRKAAAESRADNGSSIPKPLQQGDTLTTGEDGQQGKVLAIANDGKVAVEWGNGHTGLYTPKEIEEYGYRRAEPRIGAVVTGYDSSTGMATFNFVQMPEQPTQEEVDEANWGHLTSNPQTPSPKPQSLILGLSEVHYAVRKFAVMNDRRWDEQTCDEVAAAVLDFLAEY